MTLTYVPSTWHPGTLSALLPRTHAISVALVVSAALITAASAQISLSLPFTPVPITMQTGAVFLSGSALGWRRGGASQILYVGLGAVGLPFFADGASGWSVVTGATGGYLIGFIIAAAMLGFFAERGGDRNLANTIPGYVLASVIIYAFGSAWLAYRLEIPLAGAPGSTDNAIALGVTPFLLGDIAKALVVATITPSVWRFITRGDRSSNSKSQPSAPTRVR